MLSLLSLVSLWLPHLVIDVLICIIVLHRVSGLDTFKFINDSHQCIISKHNNNNNVTYELLHYGDDLSWREYLSEIYKIHVDDDANVDLLSKRFQLSTLDLLLYPTANVDVKDFNDRINIYDYFHHKRYNTRVPRRSLNSNEWIEVWRFSNYVMCGWGLCISEGYSTGIVMPPFAPPYDKFPYGCWFTTGVGTNQYVNTGRVLNAVNRIEVKSLLNLTTRGCLHEMTDCTRDAVDNYFCTGILKLNYDSLFIIESGEFIYCNGRCKTEPFRTCCPLVEMKSGINASLPCSCNDTWEIANCGGKRYSDRALIHDVYDTMPGINRHFTCFLNEPIPDSTRLDFKLEVAFTSDIIKDISEIESIYNSNDIVHTLMDDISPHGQILLDVNMATSIISTDVLHNFTESYRYMMIEDKNIIHMDHKPLTRSLYIHDKTIQASILNKIVDMNGLSIGILSLRSPDEWYLNIAMGGEDGDGSSSSSGSSSKIDPELVRWIIDEALCLRHKGARVVLFLTKATWKVNYNYIAKGTYGYIDAILAANQHTTSDNSCQGLYHNLTTKVVPVVQLSKAGTHSSIQLGVLQFNHISNQGMTITSNILTIPTIVNANKQRLRR